MVKVYYHPVFSKFEVLFEKGDVVEVMGVNGLIGKGQVSCSSEELSAHIEERKEKGPEFQEPAIEVIHRDNWVQLKR